VGHIRDGTLLNQEELFAQQGPSCSVCLYRAGSLTPGHPHLQTQLLWPCCCVRWRVDVPQHQLVPASTSVTSCCTCTRCLHCHHQPLLLLLLLVLVLLVLAAGGHGATTG
jgi:hypothetical protein